MTDNPPSPPAPADGAPADGAPADRGTGPGDDPDLSQEDQASLLTEPSFDHGLPDEDQRLAAEFGPPDAAGYYGRTAGPPGDADAAAGPGGGS